MKRIAQCLALLLVICLAAAGCDQQPPAPASAETPPPGAQSGELQGAEVVHEGEAVQMIRSMMNLAYTSMTVAEFNETIQAMCAEVGTSVFAVLSDAYDHYAVYTDTGEFAATVFKDRALEAFIETTLSYSAQEIFGEPIHLGNVMYMQMPGFTAKELYQMKQGMSFEEWDAFFEEHIAELHIFPILSYSIETAIASPGTLLVADRDSRINDTQAAIVDFFLGLRTEEAMAENMEDMLQAELARLSAEQSDDRISITCRIEGLERDMPA